MFEQMSLLDMLVEPHEVKEKPTEVLRTIEDLIEEVKAAPRIFKTYDKAIQTQELALEAFKAERENIEYVDNSLLDEEFWLKALEHYPDVLKEVSQYGKETEVIVLESVKLNPKNIGLSELQPESACLYIMDLEDRDIVEESFKYIKRPSEQVCLKYVANDGHRLSDIKKDFRTKAICLEAIKDNAWAIQWIEAEDDFSEELELEAVKQLSEVIESCPIQSEKACWMALKSDSTNIDLINKPTEEMCVYAVEKRASNLRFIREEHRTEKVCTTAVGKEGSVIKYIENPSEAVYIKAIEYSAMFYRNVPKDKVTEKICAAAVKKAVGMLDVIPEEFRTAELKMMAYEQNPEAIRYF